MKGRKYDFDVLVIGAGSAGFSAALAARRNGAHVGIIERGKLGGDCPNSACIPTKTLLHAIGRTSWKEALAKKDAITRMLTGSRLSSILEKENIALIKGSAKFVDAHTVVIGSHEWTAENVIIAGGTQTAIPEIAGLSKSGFLTYADVVSLKKLPTSIAILGGGPVGVEFAEIMHGFGVTVYLIQRAPRLLPREESEVSSVIEESFREKGIGVYTGAECIAVTKKSGYRELTIRQGKMEFDISAETILLATGKRSLARDMEVEKAGIKLEVDGCIRTDAFLHTNVKNIFAVGDVKCGLRYTHVASYDGEIAGHNATTDHMVAADYKVVPRAVFCSPEVASVGLTEEDARAAGKWHVGTGKAFFAGFGKALTQGSGEGIVKVVVDTRSGKILGAGIVGNAASELIHELALAMQVGATYHDVAEMMHAYPTGSEVVKMACANVDEV